MHTSTKKNKGFTLIELLLVISIISLFSSIIFFQLSLGRTRAINARKVLEVKDVGRALTIFADEYNKVPLNYNYDSASGLYNIACDDSAYPASKTAYEASMQELVNAGIIKSIPRSSGNNPYCYYDYGRTSDTKLGGVFFTAFEENSGSGGGSGGLTVAEKSIANTSCHGLDIDFNNNGVFDSGYDYTTCLTVYRTTGPYAPGSVGYRCDVDNSGAVDRDDYTVWRRNFNLPIICSLSSASEYCSCQNY